jgi:hypothetical protein
MLSDRGWPFIKNFQTIYWMFVISVFVAVLLTRSDVPLFIYDLKIPIAEETLPGLIIAFSILVTAIWSYIFLLLPMHKTKETFYGKPTCKIVFFFLCYFTLVAAIFLFVVYCVALKGNASEVSYAAIRKVFSEASPYGSFLHEHHLILFVLLYTIMDGLVAVACTDERQKRQFADVVIFVDIPILLSMAFIEFVLKPRIGSSFYLFQAGVVSFQLIAGSLSVIGLEVLEDRIDDARRASVHTDPSAGPGQ